MDEFPRSDRIRIPSSAEFVADLLRERLLRGEVAPGTALEEVRLAESFGVSRNTFREALRILAAEHLVRREPHRSVTVVEVAEPEIADIYRGRRVIELAACAAADSASSEWRQRFRLAFEALSNASTWNEVDAADLHFHRVLVEAIGSKRILRFYLSVQTELRLVNGWAAREPLSSAQMAASHGPLFNAVVDHAPERAASELDRLLAGGEQRVLTAVRRRLAGVQPATEGSDGREGIEAEVAAR